MKKLAFVAIAFALLVPTASASAASSTRLDTVKAKSDTAIKSRIEKLDDLKSQINSSKYVNAAHKSGLLTEVANDEQALNALDTKIQADTDATSAVTDAKTIVTSYRVYVLEVPKVHEVIAADTMSTVVTQLQTVSPKLATELQAAKTAGKNTSTADTALADLNSKASAIDKSNQSLADNVLALTPDGWPTNKATIQTTRRTLGTEVTSAKAARQDITAIQSAIGK